jgi:hypothetical protein
MFIAALALLVQAVPAAASSEPGAPCSDATVSANNQYCENIPAATGGRTMGPGSPVLGSRLPPALVNRIRGNTRGGTAGASSGATHQAATPAAGKAAATRHTRSEQARRALLSLPAPGPRAALRAPPPAHTSSWSLFSGLIIVLAIATLALSVLAFAQRRRTSGA